MLLIVGLGNPGGKYARHRHNVGFMAVDAIASAHGFSAPRKKFQGEIAEGSMAARGKRDKIAILKPATFMNESGRAVGEAMRFHKIAPGDVIVLHDELDLAPGKVRMKTGGGHAGHNGLKSIAAHIGPDFRRLRIGIGHPGHKDRVSGFVLGDFAKADQVWLEPLLDDMARAAPFLLLGDKEFQNELGRLRGPGEGAASASPARADRSGEGRPSSVRPAATKAQAPGDRPVPKSGKLSGGDNAAPKNAAAGNPFADALKKLIKRS